jgi:hypothetical protein
MRASGVIGIVCLLASFRAVALDEPPAARPVMRLNVPDPTRDKPQSKLWFARGSWWAWLPVRRGSGIWRRTENGWQQDAALEARLRGLPGQADVWAEGDHVRAVLVEPRRLAVVGLTYDAALQRYRLTGAVVEFAMPEGVAGPGLETATIARDGRGRWWIAYGWRRHMWVRASHDPESPAWTEPVAISPQPASDDDICAIAALPGGVGVIWSNQAIDTVYFRRHNNDAAPETWAEPEVVDRGNRTADDHLHTAVAGDGTLYVATKNSLDRVGHPQLVLRIRRPRGGWENHPYAPRTERSEPSRPAVVLGGEPERYFLFHSVYGREQGEPRSWIVWQSRLDEVACPFIAAGTRINNVTTCKSRLPAGHPWIVLASDHQGNVYEGTIDSMPRR